MNVLIIGELNEKMLSTNSVELVGKAKQISESIFKSATSLYSLFKSESINCFTGILF